MGNNRYVTKDSFHQCIEIIFAQFRLFYYFFLIGGSLYQNHCFKQWMILQKTSDMLCSKKPPHSIRNICYKFMFLMSRRTDVLRRYVVVHTEQIMFHDFLYTIFGIEEIEHFRRNYYFPSDRIPDKG